MHSEEMLYSEEGSAIERIQTILHQGREMAAIDPSLSQPLKILESHSDSTGRDCPCPEGLFENGSKSIR